jgi:hypothetical protein
MRRPFRWPAEGPPRRLSPGCSLVGGMRARPIIQPWFIASLNQGNGNASEVRRVPFLCLHSTSRVAGSFRVVPAGGPARVHLVAARATQACLALSGAASQPHIQARPSLDRPVLGRTDPEDKASREACDSTLWRLRQGFSSRTACAGERILPQPARATTSRSTAESAYDSRRDGVRARHRWPRSSAPIRCCPDALLCACASGARTATTGDLLEVPWTTDWNPLPRAASGFALRLHQRARLPNAQA